MQEISPNHHYRWEMPATLADIDRIDDELTELLRQLELPLDTFAIRILLRESMLNAVTHGGQQNAGLKITLDLKLSDNSATLHICDPGRGFNWHEYTDYEPDLEEGGRGLALMRMYADSIWFNDVGNEVSLTKYFKVASQKSR